VVDTRGHQKSEQETADDRAQKERVLETERRTLWAVECTAYATIALVLVGLCGTGAAIWTLRQIKRQADLIERQANTMENQLTDARTASAQQAKDLQASVAEAARSAKAMEGVATSVASSAASVRESVGISRKIADMQKLGYELAGRAYLSVSFENAIYQDANNVFEARGIIRNHGNTPAYKVSFKTAAAIVNDPVPEGFDYPLPEESAGMSVSLLAPQATKSISRLVREKVPDGEVEPIKFGGPKCLAMWGIIKYRDAFNKPRHTKFAFTIRWIPMAPGAKDKDGNLLPPHIMSYDTARHNDAD
jgi:hypothetical protein